jgi:hypothetical protein
MTKRKSVWKMINVIKSKFKDSKIIKLSWSWGEHMKKVVQLIASVVIFVVLGQNKVSD